MLKEGAGLERKMNVLCQTVPQVVPVKNCFFLRNRKIVYQNIAFWLLWEILVAFYSLRYRSELFSILHIIFVSTKTLRYYLRIGYTRAPVSGFLTDPDTKI